MFAKTLVHSVHSTDAAEEPSPSLDTLYVGKVAAGSLASAIGVTEGDLLISINEKPPCDMDLTELAITEASLHYVCYQPGKRRLLSALCSSAPLGVELHKSASTVLRSYSTDPHNSDHTDLYPIWNSGDWQALRDITLKAINPVKMSLLNLFRALYYSPEYLLYGAALYELGQHAQGMKIIRRFERCQPQAHTQEQDAIVDYYYARQLRDQDLPEEAADLLLEAFAAHPHQRIGRLLRKLTGREYTPQHRWSGEKFTCDYRLERADSSGEYVDFTATIDDMNERQILLLCNLASYRTNRFYNAFMHRYLAWKRHFGEFIHDLHVASCAPEQENCEEYFYHEARAAGALGPVKLLDDSAWQLTHCLEPDGSPTIYAIGKDRNVLFEGDPFDVDFWNIIGHLEQG